MIRQTRSAAILFLLIFTLPAFVHAQDNKAKAREHYQKGDALFLEGKYKEAQDEFQKAIESLGKKSDPVIPQAGAPLKESGPYLLQDNKALAREYYTKGNAYFKEGRYKEAQEEFQKAMKALSKKSDTPVPVAPAPVEKPVEPPPPEETKEPEAPKVAAQAAEVKTRPSEYTIGTEDVLRISVWQNPDLDQDTIVRPDGKISVPLIGDIQAEGQTIPELDGEITQRLTEYIKYPQVSISIVKMGGRKVLVLGEVTYPGVYHLTGESTLLEAIAEAGGFTDDAVLSSVIVVKGGIADPKGVRLNLNRSLLKGDTAGNMILAPQDIVYVPKKFIANVNYFVNQLIGPVSSGATAIYNTQNLRNQRW